MAVDVHARVLVGRVDLAADARSASVTWGRTEADGQPESATCSAELEDPTGSIASSLRIGDDFQLVARVVGGRESVRFTGTLHDAVLEHGGVLRIAGQSILGRLSRVHVGDEPWPAESDGDRVLRILQAAGINTAPPPAWESAVGTWDDNPYPTWRGLGAPDVDLGSVTILPRDVDRQPVTALLRSVADSAGGVVFERRNGNIAYHDADRRTMTAKLVTLGRVWLSEGTRSETSLGTMVNRVTVEYGVAPEGGERPTVVVEDSQSLDEFGELFASVTTELRDVLDADRLGRRTVAWRGRPRWSIGQLNADTSALDDVADVDGLLGLELGDTLNVEGVAPPTPGSPSVIRLIVEGASESFADLTWTTALAVSSIRASVVPASWADHAERDPGRQWATAPPPVIWNDADLLLYPA